MMLETIPFWWRMAGLAAIVSAIFGAGYLSGVRHGDAKADAIQAQFDGFVEQTRAIGLQANAAAAAREKSDHDAKLYADSENTRASSAAAADARKLRDDRARGSFMPIQPPGAGSAGRACFDRAELEQALQRLDGEVSEIVESGDQAVIDLDTAKGWALRLKSTPQFTPQNR